MKKFFSVFMIAVCCMALAMPAQAQLIKFGVKGGVNLSKLKFEGMKDNSTGFFFGPMAEITIPVIGLGVDGALLYSQKGDKMEGLDMKQSGLDIPVNLKYSIGLGSMLAIYVEAATDFCFNFKSEKNFEIENLENEPFMLSEHGGKNEVTELLEKNGVHPQK